MTQFADSANSQTQNSSILGTNILEVLCCVAWTETYQLQSFKTYRVLKNGRILIADLNYILNKLEKWLGSWSNGNLSYASHTMNMYFLTEGTHTFIARCTLLLGRLGMKTEIGYHMVKWIDLWTPKEFGTLGCTEARKMDIFLFIKWYNLFPGV